MRWKQGFGMAMMAMLAAGAGACGPDGAPADAEAAASSPPAATRVQQSVPQPPEIYYDLTRFDWYRMGEPLRADSGAYLPAGDPVKLPLAQLDSAGRYQGVAYYRARDATDAHLYVPVFESYWQPFAARSARR